MNRTNVKNRWVILCFGVFAMLSAGIIYAWSILKSPFAEEFDFSPSTLSLNFTLTMSFFCLGGFLSSHLVRRIGTCRTILAASLLSGLGFILAALVGTRGALALYFTYALLAGLGIGMAYIVIVSTVNAHFPDRKGLSSGALMMGFGASTLVLGNVADALFQSSFGFRNTYIAIGIVCGVAAMIFSMKQSKKKEEVIQ